MYNIYLSTLKGSLIQAPSCIIYVDTYINIHEYMYIIYLSTLKGSLIQAPSCIIYVDSYINIHEYMYIIYSSTLKEMIQAPSPIQQRAHVYKSNM